MSVAEDYQYERAIIICWRRLNNCSGQYQLVSGQFSTLAEGKEPLAGNTQPKAEDFDT